MADRQTDRLRVAKLYFSESIKNSEAKSIRHDVRLEPKPAPTASLPRLKLRIVLYLVQKISLKG